jgi:biotin carboxyl carrier protein
MAQIIENRLFIRTVGYFCNKLKMQKMSSTRYYIAGKEITNTTDVSFEMIEKNGFLTIEKGDQTYNIIVDRMNLQTKEVDLLINNVLYQISMKTSLDDLLESMGMDLTGSKKLKEIKSPMPGRVLQFLKNPGDEVAPGDGILVLEAMKMENVIKSEGSGVVKGLEVQTDAIVNKGDLLVSFE